MMTHHAKPISSRDDAVGVTTWLWADHNGLHCGPALPATAVVPTGHLWGWGEAVRVHLREDAMAPSRGILLSDQPGPDTTAAVTVAYATGPYPSTITDRQRFLRCASDEDQRRFDALNLDVLVVVSPTQAILVADRTS